MYEVTVSDRSSVLRTVIVRHNGKMVGAASLRFIHWLSQVPADQLDATQRALVAWYQGQEGLADEGRASAPCRSAA